jgi:hypothetical protein
MITWGNDDKLLVISIRIMQREKFIFMKPLRNEATPKRTLNSSIELDPYIILVAMLMMCV